eukprot:gnl/MRDRNA2_/MRDRNA2_56967_c0_seq1.p1 gnl/MRDRNA2_/MRDRNA2_56967_c0~~gnl/MRDRNA2_/MRDRNA2_56967_c0_seq1.p1  ORF type:complete len:1042 (+),score=122.69 gnl/MRDRNA2_/MRDRNA2_56967_c0_seq1:93-3128(+)
MSPDEVVDVIEEICSRRPVLIHQLRASGLFNNVNDSSVGRSGGEISVAPTVPTHPGTPLHRDQKTESAESTWSNVGDDFAAKASMDFPSKPNITVSDCPDRTKNLKANISNTLSPIVPKTTSGFLDPANSRQSSASLFGNSSTDAEEAVLDVHVILQFSTYIYYVKEGEEEQMVVDVLRLGDSSQKCSVSYATNDGSAHAGIKYVATQGVLEFEIGETSKEIAIPILSDDAWDEQREFTIKLSTPQNAILGKYLHTCRVKIIGSICFPSDRHKEMLLASATDPDKLKEIPIYSLILEYFKMNLRHPEIRKRTRQMLILDQTINVYFIWRLLIIQTIIDRLFKSDGCPEDERFWFEILPCPADSSDRNTMLVVMAIFVIVPMVFNHFIEYKRIFWKVGGMSRMTIQANLMRKFLNYDEYSLAKLSQTDLIIAMTRDTFEVVHNGYLKIFPLSLNFWRLIMLLTLQVYNGSIFATIPVIVSPIVLLIFLRIRTPRSMKVSLEQDTAYNEKIRFVGEVLRCYHLITDFAKRPWAVDTFEKKIKDFNMKLILADADTLNNSYMAPWLSIIMIGGWLIVGGMRVVNRQSTIGEFVTNLEVFNALGQAWMIIYVIMLQMMYSCPSLFRLTRYLNLPTDVEKRMRLNRRRRKEGEQARQLARAELISGLGSMASGTSISSSAGPQTNGKAGRCQGTTGDMGSSLMNSYATSSTQVYAADNVQIGFEKVCYHYNIGLWNAIRHRGSIAAADGVGIKGSTFKFAQGKLVTLIGSSGEGKSTMLKLLSGVLLPESGYVMIPPHLRVLHCSQEPIFFCDTLYNNLTYGVPKGDPDGRIERVRAICERLLLPDRVLEFLSEEHMNGKHDDITVDWGEVLRLTERYLLVQARALIANPEVLVLHKPTLACEERLALNTFSMLREFCQQRGLEMDRAMLAHRRPRTCICSTIAKEGIALSDHVLNVQKSGTVREMTEKEIEDIVTKLSVPRQPILERNSTCASISDRLSQVNDRISQASPLEPLS